MFKNIKISISILFLLAILAPQTSFALDTRCWTKESCIQGTGTEGAGVFYGPTDETKGVCGGETTIGSSGETESVGFCLPAGQAVTGVKFSGRTQFLHFGDFIKWIYQYGIQVAAILAVVMIIVAGIQWAVSGGSSERVGVARKRIGGALMGLFLVLMSYLLLNLINPYMINLRMPQVWKINTLGISPPYCDMIKDGKKVSESAAGPFTIDPTNTKNTTCGKDYFVQGTEMTCKGRGCSKGSCFPVRISSGKMEKNPICEPKYDILVRYRITGSFRTAAKIATGDSYWGGLLASTLGLNNIPDADDAEGWIDRKDFYLWDGCKNKTGEYKASTGRWSLNQKVFFHAEEVPNQKWKDIYVYYDLDELSLTDVSKCPDGFKEGVAGFFLEHEIDILGNPSEAVFYVSVSKDGAVMYAGSWKRIWANSNSTYILPEKKGYFEINFDDQILSELTT